MRAEIVELSFDFLFLSNREKERRFQGEKMTHFHSSAKIWPAALLALAFAGSVASAQQPIRPIGPLTPINLKIATLQVKIAPQLKTYLLANKAKIAPEVLDQSFALKGNLPAFKLPDGTLRVLMPLSAADGESNVSEGDNNAPIPEEVEEAREYIRAPLELNRVMQGRIRISPKFVLADVVDHRPQMTPIRDQGPRGTCVAHAVCGALEAFSSIPNNLSEQYAYNLFMQKEGREPCYDEGLVTINSAGYMADGIVEESVWNYTNSLPPCNTTPPVAANTAKKYKITSFQLINDNGLTGASIKNPNYLETLLRAGRNIVFGTHVAWNGAQASGIMDVVINSATNQPAESRGGHAMVIVGYNRPQKYFIVRNSWGTGFGHDGYMFLSYDYIRTYAKYGYYIKSVSPSMVIMPKIEGTVTPVKPRIRIPR